jgi:uncharacterized protein (DUF2062 family)
VITIATNVNSKCDTDSIIKTSSSKYYSKKNESKEDDFDKKVTETFWKNPFSKWTKGLGAKSLLHKILALKDCPYKLAKSISLGFGLAFLPLPGLNLPLGIILAKLFRLSIVATSLPALLLTYVSPFIYVLNYKTGAFLLSPNKQAMPQQYDVAYNLTFFEKAIDFVNHAGTTFLLGSLINSLIASSLSYVIFLLIYKNAHKIVELKRSRSKNKMDKRISCKEDNL